MRVLEEGKGEGKLLRSWKVVLSVEVVMSGCGGDATG